MAPVNSDALLSAGLDLIDMGYGVTVSRGSKGNQPFLREWQYHALPAEHLHRFVALDRTTGIGAITTGLAVIDIDGVQGLDNWKIFLAEHDIDPSPFREQMVLTPGGGQHLYLRDTHQTVTNAGGLLGPVNKIDVRGIGGFVAMPPTERTGTAGYQWLRGPLPIDQLPEAPSWLAGKLLRTSRGDMALSPIDRIWAPELTPWGEAQVTEMSARITDTGSGGRHQALFVGAAAAGHLIAEGKMTVEYAYESLDSAAQVAGLYKEGRADEVKRTILDGFNSAFGRRLEGLEALIDKVEGAR
jgi:hypothetical protein